MSDEVPTGALFPPWTTTAVRALLVIAVLTPPSAFALLLVYVRSPLFTGQYAAVRQPIQFDHRHHVGDEGVDCRYCHATADKSASAGFPSTEVCMGCHNQIWNQSPVLASVRQSYFTGTPLRWRRVHQLPDFVYFNHSIHVNKGVGCVDCHGPVDEMGQVMRVAPLTMGWCLDCHRDPIPHLRPPEYATSTTWKSDDAAATGREVAQVQQVHTRTSCTTCHR